jgi:hypothetical protein
MVLLAVSGLTSHWSDWGYEPSKSGFAIPPPIHQLSQPLMMDVSTLLELQRLVATRLGTGTHTGFMQQATATHSNIKGCDVSPQMGR